MEQIRKMGIRIFSLTTFLVLMQLSVSCAEEHLRIAAASTTPPYIITESGTGIDIDIVRQALAYEGYDITFQYDLLRNIPILLGEKKVDGAMTISEKLEVDGVCYTDVYTTYQNVAVTLQDKHFSISTVQDLAGKSVAAFQNATKYLGDDYASSTRQCSNYTELSRQDLQTALLYSDQVDVLILDINIFYYFLNMFTREHPSIDTSQAVTIHKIFPATPYKVAFWREDLCESFNKGLARLKKKGEDKNIISRYINQTPSAPSVKAP